MLRLQPSLALPLLLLAAGCSQQSYTPIGDEDSADVACRSSDIEFADSGTEAQVYELTDQAVVFEGSLDVDDMGSYYEVRTDEAVIQPPLGESFALRISSNEVIERTNFLFQLDYREVGTEDWTGLDIWPNSAQSGESFLDVNIFPLTDEGKLFVYYVSIGARTTNCELATFSDENAITWDTSKRYEYRVRPFVKSGLGDLDGTGYAFRVEAELIAEE